MAKPGPAIGKAAALLNTRIGVIDWFHPCAWLARARTAPPPRTLPGPRGYDRSDSIFDWGDIMKRWTTGIELALPLLAAILIMLAVGVARADECPNKFDQPKDAAGVGDTKADAEKAYKAKIAEYVRDQKAECKKHKCKGKKQCTPIHVETPGKCSESKDKNFPGWACTGKFRGGCFCLTDAEEPGGTVPIPPGTATPSETASECENKFGDQVDILGIGDNDTKAKAAHTQALKERKDIAAKECSEKKCPDQSARASFARDASV